MADESGSSVVTTAAGDGSDAAAGSAVASVDGAVADATTATAATAATAAPASGSGSGSSAPAKASDKATDKPSDADAGDATDAEIEAMKKRVKEMEDEAKKIEDLQSNAEKALKPKSAAAAAAAASNGPDVDARSVYVGNVDYATTPEELQEFFASCGVVNRITIPADKFTGQPKGFAYVEFKDADAIANAMLLADAEFKGRPLKVTQKRTNLPGMADFRGRRPRGIRGAPRGGAGFRSPTRGPPGYNGYPSYGAAPRARFRSRRFSSPYSR